MVTTEIYQTSRPSLAVERIRQRASVISSDRRADVILRAIRVLNQLPTLIGDDISDENRFVPIFGRGNQTFRSYFRNRLTNQTGFNRSAAEQIMNATVIDLAIYAYTVNKLINPDSNLQQVHFEAAIDDRLDRRSAVWVNPLLMEKIKAESAKRRSKAKPELRA